MHRLALFLTIAAMTAVATRVEAQTGAQQKMVSRDEASSQLQIENLQTSSDGTASGTLHNTTQMVIKDVKLLVKHTWAWKDERHPGDVSPGTSAFFTVPGPIPAGGSAPFSYKPNPALPDRTDGHFTTTVGIQEFSQVGE